MQSLALRFCRPHAHRPPGLCQFALPISRASSDRTYPGGLPRFDRTSSQSPEELTTLSLVPPLIWEITREAGEGFSYTDVARVVS
jgi:hypothetical protein